MSPWDITAPVPRNAPRTLLVGLWDPWEMASVAMSMRLALRIRTVSRVGLQDQDGSVLLSRRAN